MANGNNEKLRKWIGTLIPIIILLGSVIIWGQNLSGGITAVGTALAQHQKTDCVREDAQEKALDILKAEGCDPARSNEKRLIRVEKDGEYTRKAVTRIEAIVTEIAKQQ